MPSFGPTLVDSDRPDGDVRSSLPFPVYDQQDHEAIRVLLVDDEPGLAEVVKDYLERSKEEITAVTEPGPDDGLARLDAESFDCIVSDYDMPGANGLEFLELLPEQYRDVPFILFTGKGSEEIASDAIAAGVTDYMQKGFGTDQYELLANRIVNAVERHRTERELWAAFSWYRRLVEQNLAGIYVIQHEETVYVNEKFAEIFGYSQEELIGRSPFDVVDERDHDVLRENLRKREAGEIESIEYALVGKRKDGSTLDIKAHGGVIDFRGEPAVMGVLLDASE